MIFYASNYLSHFTEYDHNKEETKITLNYNKN